MPKRTNFFQQLIHYIYSEMVPAGFTVTESVLLDQREVDILVEGEVAGTKLRIAVECRDRSRKNDIEWIDCLVGKYLDLDVQKVIAVSNSGFSQKARDKAAANRIEIRTPQQALSTDWPAEFIKIGIGKLTRQTLLDRVHVETEPPLMEQPKRTDVITDQSGNSLTTLDELLKDAYNRKILNDLQEYIRHHFLDNFKVLADLDKILLCEQRLTAPNLYLIDVKGVTRKILSITFSTKSLFSAEKTKVQNYSYEKALITTGVVNFNETAATYTVNAVQIGGQDQVKVFINPEEIDKGKE